MILNEYFMIGQKSKNSKSIEYTNTSVSTVKLRVTTVVVICQKQKVCFCVFTVVESFIFM